MIQLMIRLGLVLLVAYQLATPCEAIRSYGYGIPGIPGMPGSRGYERGYQGYEGAPVKSKTYSGSSASFPSEPTTRRGLGISAWGIIFLVVAIILAGVGCYYFSICYPTVCMNRNKYDMMGLPPTMV